jgi:hypothetical protein
MAVLAKASSNLHVKEEQKQKLQQTLRYIERRSPPLAEEQTPLLNTYLLRREQICWSVISMRPEVESECASEGQ